jgi:hypothetical protein
MSGTELRLFVDDLRSGNFLDDSVETDGGVLVTTVGSNEIDVLAAGANGQVLSYDDTVATTKLRWVAQTGGSGGTTYTEYSTSGFVVASNDETNVAVLTLAGAGATPSGTIPDGAVNGRHLMIVLKTIDVGATCTITPATAFVGGGISMSVDTAGQGKQLVWCNGAWAATPGGCTVNT